MTLEKRLFLFLSIFLFSNLSFFFYRRNDTAESTDSANLSLVSYTVAHMVASACWQCSGLIAKDTATSKSTSGGTKEEDIICDHTAASTAHYWNGEQQGRPTSRGKRWVWKKPLQEARGESPLLYECDPQRKAGRKLSLDPRWLLGKGCFLNNKKRQEIFSPPPFSGRSDIDKCFLSIHHPPGWAHPQKKKNFYRKRLIVSSRNKKIWVSYLPL